MQHYHSIFGKLTVLGLGEHLVRFVLTEERNKEKDMLSVYAPTGDVSFSAAQTANQEIGCIRIIHKTLDKEIYDFILNPDTNDQLFNLTKLAAILKGDSRHNYESVSFMVQQYRKIAL